MQSFGWTTNVYAESSCGGGGYYFFLPYDTEGDISIPLPTGFSDFTIEYGQSCYSYPGSSVNIQLNGVVVNSIDETCAAGTSSANSCWVYPPVESCLKTFSMKYSPGDVLSIEETGTSIALIKTIKLSPSTQHTLPPCTKAYASTKCAAGTELTEAECRAYGGAAAGLIFRATFSSTSYPSGCWRYWSSSRDSIYFVPTDHDAYGPNAAPICKSGCV